MKHRTRPDDTLPDLERAFEDVPDLSEIVAMEPIVRTRFVPHVPGIGFGGAIGSGVEQRLAVLAREAERFPGHVVNVPDFDG
ncbi:MAG: hypothetical protein ACKVQU_32185 [Burkholderiales bacterium]